MTFQTEFEFVLPKGYLDENGKVHQHGRMRLATAFDELNLLQHPWVKENISFLPVVLLAQVVTHLGDLPMITPNIISNLFATDLAYLEELYQRVNCTTNVVVGASCPYCHSQFQLEVAPLDI